MVDTVRPAAVVRLVDDVGAADAEQPAAMSPKITERTAPTGSARRRLRAGGVVVTGRMGGNDPGGERVPPGCTEILRDEDTVPVGGHP